jgi:hypothetical protein
MNCAERVSSYWAQYAFSFLLWYLFGAPFIPSPAPVNTHYWHLYISHPSSSELLSEAYHMSISRGRKLVWEAGEGHR